jgi:DNA polymerase-1
MQHLVLIDGHHLMYRAYWAIPRTLKTAGGEQVNTVFGVASMLLNILKKEEPDAFLLCFDAGDETFRHQEHAEYKEGRAQTPDDFYIQIPRVMEMLAAWELPVVADARYEADDFLCSYAHAAQKAGMRVTIVTGDRDAFQLISQQTKVAIPHKGYQEPRYLGREELLQEYGVTPEQIVDYKGLVGDSSDNLPGVKGIGPKGAAELLAQYQTLENIYQHLEDIRPAVRAKLVAGQQQAFFCKRMATLVCDIPLPVPLRGLLVSPRSTAALLTIFHTLEFTMLSRRLSDFARTPYGEKLFIPATAQSRNSGAVPAPQQSLF